MIIKEGNEIWRVNIDGSKTRLTSSDDRAYRPQYSPNGLKIAFISQKVPLSLYVANTDFSEPVLIVSGSIEDFAWGSNSSELIYSLYDSINKNNDLWKVSIDGNEKQQFSNTSVSEDNISCSRDGNYIAYDVYNAVYVTPADTFQPKKVLDNARLPKWIPERDLLLITSEQTSDNKSFWTEAWIVGTDGNVIEKIARGSSYSLDFSSNGVYFVYTSSDGNLWIDQLPH